MIAVDEKAKVMCVFHYPYLIYYFQRFLYVMKEKKKLCNYSKYIQIKRAFTKFFLWRTASSNEMSNIYFEVT